MASDTVTRTTGYRPELQGLRALAVLLVVTYHVWVGRVSGGVDVFFVVTGFLLTGQLVRAAERGALSVRARYTRAVARLVPAASVVLLAVVAAGVLVLPESRWAQSAREVAAAALFTENWQLAADSVDYTARSNMTSVVQHFWSLAIQGQVLLVWPLLVAAVAMACGERRDLVRPRTTLALAGILAASLVYSVGLTAGNQPLAYFHTLTRLWEFALGGLLALHVDRLTLAPRARVALGWAGVLGLVACGAALPVASLFPGWVALWPTGCAAAVLAAGHTGHRWAADRLLTCRLAQWLGAFSYPLYLWHWPLLISVLALGGRDEAGPLTGVAVVGASMVLAHATHLLVERPAARRPGGFRLAALGTVAALLAAGGWQVAVLARTEPQGTLGDVSHAGALALREPTPDAGAPTPTDGDTAPTRLLPPPALVLEDWNRIEYWDCTPMREFPMDACALPRPTTEDPSGGQVPANPPAKRIVVVGDSHAQQLSAALVPLARANDWQLIDIIRGACPFSTVSETDPDDLDCAAWLDAAADTILDLRPDVVVTLASRDVRVGLTEQTPGGFVEQWRRLDGAGIPVLAIRDNPRFDTSMPDCVHRNGLDPAVCGSDRAALYAPEPPWAGIPDVPRNVAFVDIADAVCTPDRCPAVIGDVLVYLDDNHLTATYATSMAPLIEQQVRTGLGW